MFFLTLNTCGKTRHVRHTLAGVQLKARRHLAATLYDDDTQWLSAANKVETPMRVAFVDDESSAAAIPPQ